MVNKKPCLLNGNIKNLNSEIRTYKNLDPLHWNKKEVVLLLLLNTRKFEESNKYLIWHEKIHKYVCFRFWFVPSSTMGTNTLRILLQLNSVILGTQNLVISGVKQKNCWSVWRECHSEFFGFLVVLWHLFQDTILWP